MAALHAPVALWALANVDVKRPDDRALDRQLFLILGRDTHAPQCALTPRTARRQGRLADHIDVRRRLPLRERTIGAPGFSTRSTRLCDACAAGNRRGLPRDRAPRGLELLFQLLVFAAQPLALRFRTTQILAQAFDFPCLVFDDLLRITRRIGRAARHAVVMPETRSKYKRECGSALY